jgi:hypothetical protein
MPPIETPPCRLYVILAREANVGVIFRRGPSKHTQIIRWDTATDTFTHGKWFKGRLFWEHSDLSPDGTLMIYSAQNMSAHARASAYGSNWTAISKPPYLWALALWPSHSGWVGGGLFRSNRDVWLDQVTSEPHPEHVPVGLNISNDPERGIDPLLWYRVARDGWEHIYTLRKEWQPIIGETITVKDGYHRKPMPQGSLALTFTTAYANHSHHDSYVIVCHGDESVSLPGVEWADWDHRGRLVYARAGKLFAMDVSGGYPGVEVELADFNAAKPEYVETPAWARVW